MDMVICLCITVSLCLSVVVCRLSVCCLSTLTLSTAVALLCECRGRRGGRADRPGREIADTDSEDSPRPCSDTPTTSAEKEAWMFRKTCDLYVKCKVLRILT